MFYDVVLLIRPDIAMGYIGDITDKIKEIVENKSGRVVCSEYWGFRTLSYRVKKKSKAHYVFLGISADSNVLEDLHHYMKFHKDILRFLFVRNEENFSGQNTPLFHSTLSEAISGVGPASLVVSTTVEEAVEEEESLEVEGGSNE